MVDALSIAVSFPPITGAHTLLSIICLSSDTMTSFASCPLVRNASLTLILAVLLFPISSLCRFITSATSCVVGDVLTDLGTVPPVFVTNASSFVRVDLVTIRSVGTGTLRCSLTGDCTVCAGCCGTDSISGAGVSAGMSSGSGGGVGGVSRSRSCTPIVSSSAIPISTAAIPISPDGGVASAVTGVQTCALPIYLLECRLIQAVVWVV